MSVDPKIDIPETSEIDCPCENCGSDLGSIGNDPGSWVQLLTRYDDEPNTRSFCHESCLLRWLVSRENDFGTDDEFHRWASSIPGAAS